MDQIISESRKFCLNSSVVSHTPLIVRTAAGDEFELETGAITADETASLLNSLTEERDVAQLASLLPTRSTEHVHTLVDHLAVHGIIRPVVPSIGRTGLDALLEIEDLSNRLLYQTLYRNEFWINCSNATKPGDIPQSVIYGMVIENYHFLFRESYFDAPVLSYVPNTDVRLAMNEFFAEEYGHDELLLKALNQIGISREDLAHTVPLPQTMALCNSLAYWSHNDPLFFFTTLGILEGKDIRQDSFLDAAYRIGIDSDFLKPVKAHSDINLQGEHGSLTRKIFSKIPVVDNETMRRMRALTHLFIELYDAFYSSVWQHYSSTGELLRRIDKL
ncbi:iron-containing redox enzyme family protein [Paraburkholderia silvatlantica]|uniref:Heme oxygenase-like protein n=1 Tax=Paraburkholderia silvatlantica TaxID=321895 RepID=A0A2V4UAB8_9BURK|nr:iron-containing redox enzyme family protein [Paraburkholderia silvatlantica]PYE21307.1 heme oxygenase-like protein [Paraburkholderia silvatlantica]